MEKVIYTLLCLILTISIASAQESHPTDIPSLELMISFHKNKFSKLSERNEKELKHLGMSSITQQLSNDYETIHKELSARYSIISAWTTTAFEAISLAKDIKSSYILLSEFIANIQYVKNIYILQEYSNTILHLKLEVHLLTSVLKKLSILRTDAASIMLLLQELRTRIMSINEYLRNCNMMISGYIALESIGYKTTIINKARIATKIIKDYSK